MKILSLQLICLVTLLFIDGLWLFATIDPLYKPYIGHLMAFNMSYVAVVLFYLIYTLGLVLLVVKPACDHHWSFGQTALNGAILGLMCYATYDLTNQATLKDWPWLITVIDLIWGTSLTATVSVIARWAGTRS